ncbi:chromosome partitioning protein ParB (plasmid) [Vibrio coralliilyticus]|nr:chromosome partitioning protein ParB [Vibrio coralliilyticus]
MSLRERAKELGDIDLLDESEVQIQSGEKIVRIPKSEIYSAEQVRKNFKAESIEEMALSLEMEGQIQPIIVSERDSRGYCIQKGERRWRGAQMNPKVTHLDCIIRAPGTIWGQLAENVIREDLSPFEIGMGIKQGKEEDGLDNKGAAKRLAISVSKVSAYLKATEAPDVVKRAYQDGLIGDVDTINSLRIAHNLNAEATEELLAKSEGLSRKAAQDLTKTLKNEHKTEDSNDKPEPAPKGTSNSSRQAKPKAQSLRVKVGKSLGVIDMKGEAKEGELIVLLDGDSNGQAVSASDVEVIGYHFA